MSIQSKDITTSCAWGRYDLEERQLTKLSFGPLRLWTLLVENEIRVAHAYPEISEKDSASCDKPEEDQWWRWALKQATHSLLFQPCFPDKPVVMKPEHPLTLSVGSSVRIYVRVPVWIRIVLPENDKSLVEIPSVVLSNTWFGAFTEGELCYWISSSARRAPIIEPDKNHLAICPINIKNTAKEDLRVEKLRLKVDAISLFKAGDQLWGSETRVSYRGGNQASQVEASIDIPDEASNGELITPPRNPVNKKFALRSFGRNWGLPGLGFLGEL